MLGTSEHLDEAVSRLRIGRVNVATDPLDLADDTESMVELGRGAVLVVDNDWPEWKRRHIMHLARVIWKTRISPDSVAVLESAALVWGIPVLHEGETVHLSRAASRNRHRYQLHESDEFNRVKPPSIVRHGFALEPDEWVELAGIRVSSLDRLAMDFARLRQPRVSLPVIDAVLRRLAAGDRRERTGTLERAAEIRARWVATAENLKGIRGIRRARALLPHADPLSEAIGESAVRWALLALGLPPPITQAEIPLGNGRSYFPDLLIEELAVIIEFDGALKFEGEGAAERLAAHERRHNELVARGYTVIHLGWDDILTAATLQRALVRHLGHDVLARYDARLDILEPGFLT